MVIYCNVCKGYIGFKGFPNHVKKHKKELGDNIYEICRIERQLKTKWTLIKRQPFYQIKLVDYELYPQNNTQDTPKPSNSKHNSSYMEGEKA